jgi:hypothetical protein
MFILIVSDINLFNIGTPLTHYLFFVRHIITGLLQLLIGLKCEVGQKKLKNSGSRFRQISIVQSMQENYDTILVPPKES